MNGKKLLGIVIVLTLWVAQAFSAPVDHVYVSNELVDKLNLDGSLDMNFRDPNSDTCRELGVNGNNGNVWLGCESNHNVGIYSSDGGLLYSCLGCDTGAEMCVDPYGNGWFRGGAKLVAKISPTGQLLGNYSVTYDPTAFACDRFGNVWTANSSSNNISKISNSGSLIGTFAVSNNPRGITIDSENNLWVATNAGYVDKFDNNGNQIGHYGSGIIYGYGIAIDQNGNTWTTQPFYGNIVKMSSIGNILGTFPCGGSSSSSQDVSLDASGNVWIVQRNNSKVIKLSNDGANLGTFSLSGNSGQADTGFLHQRFVLGYDTVEGPNVWVPINGGAPAGAVTLTFDNITTKGHSSYTESSIGTSPPTGYKLGTPPHYYNITTDATYTGNINVCIGYNGAEFKFVNTLRLFHNTGSAWEDITTSQDIEKSFLCGNVTTLGEFAVMQPEGNGPIPTLSEWGMIILAVMLFIALAWRLRRRYSPILRP